MKLNQKQKIRAGLMIVLSLSSFSLITSCVHLKKIEDNKKPIDYFIIHTTLGLLNTSPIPCNDDEDLTQRKVAYIFSEKDQIQINEIFNEIKTLEKDTESKFTFGTLVLSGYKNEQRVLKICTAANFTGGYEMNEEKYESNYKLDSLLATILLKKFKENDFSCTNKNESCDKIKQSLHEMERDWNAVSGILEAVIKGDKH